MLWILCMKSVDPFLHDVSEVRDQTLDRPGSRISQGTYRVTLDLLSQLPEHVDLGVRGVSLFHSLQHLNQPIGTLSARSALTARLMSVKLGESQNCLNWIDLSVHNNNGRSSEPALLLH